MKANNSPYQDQDIPTFHVNGKLVGRGNEHEVHEITTNEDERAVIKVGRPFAGFTW